MKAFDQCFTNAFVNTKKIHMANNCAYVQMYFYWTSIIIVQIFLVPGDHFQTLLSPLLKVPSMVLQSSLLLWELGTSLPGHGPGEWLSFWRVTSKQFWFWVWSVSSVLVVSNILCHNSIYLYERIVGVSSVGYLLSWHF